MLIKPGASSGAMWLYSRIMEQWAAQDLELATPENVNRSITALCPGGWRAYEKDGTWGIWPYDTTKERTHALRYLPWINKMTEVADVHAGW